MHAYLSPFWYFLNVFLACMSRLCCGHAIILSCSKTENWFFTCTCKAPPARAGSPSSHQPVELRTPRSRQGSNRLVTSVFCATPALRRLMCPFHSRALSHDATTGESFRSKMRLGMTGLVYYM